MKKVLGELTWAASYVFLVLGFRACLHAETSTSEELLATYPPAQFKLDFKDDGEQDTLTLTCKKVKDYSVDPDTKEKISEKKFVWYQFHMTIVSPNHETLWDDTYSIKDEDYSGLFENFDTPFLTPAVYIKKYFSVKFNHIVNWKISKDEIDEDLIKQKIKDTKVKVRVEDVEKEILTGKHTVVFYRGDWAVDLRQAVYSKKLRSAVGLACPY